MLNELRDRLAEHDKQMVENFCRETINQLTARLEQAERERDAYKRAKQENDERFMRERDEAREKLAAAEADRDAYAKAMAFVMRNGIFANKEDIKRELETILKDVRK